MQSEYMDDSLYIGLADKDGEFYEDVTINLPNSKTLPKDCAYIDHYKLPDIGGFLSRDGIAQPLFQSVRCEGRMYHVYKFNNLSEIDDVGTAMK